MKKYLHYLFITCILFLAFTRTVIAQTDTNYPRIINLNLTNQQAELKIMGYSGYSYLVKASTNLYDWTDIGTVGFITAGQQSLGYLYFDDIDAYSYKYRYYTVVIGTNEPIMLRIDSPTNGVYMFGTPIEVAASYDDPANVATNIAYVINGTIVYESENMTSWFTWTPTNSGMHTCFAEIRDSNGGAYRSSIIPFMIDTNHPPAFYSPLEVTSDGLGGVNIQALLEDYEGSPDHVEYYIDNQLVGMADVNMNYIFNWRGGSVGNHKVYGKGFDIYGASCWSSTNQFTLTTVSNPTIKIINPTYGSFKLQQALEITAEVNAGLNIDHVEFFIGSNSLATVSSEPYTTAWKPNEPGYFSLTAAAYDVAGTMALSAPIIVHIDTNQAPKVSIDLTNGLVVPFNSDLTFRVIVTDREGRVGDVNLFDGVNMIGSTSGQETNEFQWNAHEPGVHLFYSTAFDEQGLSAQSLIYSVTVLSNLPPVVEVTSPLHNTIINDNIIRLEATASSDNTFIDRVVFYHDDIFIGTTSSEPYYFDWSPDSPLPAGGYQIYAMAYDSIGDVTRSKVVQLLIQASLPTLTITPASGSSYGTTSSIPIAVSATGQFGVITNVTIFTNDVLLANIKTAPWTYNWSQPRTGTYRITAQTRDTKNITGYSLTNTVTVNATGPSVNWVTPTSGSYAYNTSFNLQALPSDNQMPASSMSVGYYDNGNYIGTRNYNNSFLFNNYSATPGNHTLRAYTTNSMGLVVFSDLSLTVQANRPATLALTSPTNGATITTGLTPIFVTASDPDNDTVTVTFYVDHSVLTSQTAPVAGNNYVAEINLGTGEHSIYASVSSAGFAARFSATNTITVNGDNTPPTFTAFDFNGHSPVFGLDEDIIVAVTGLVDPDSNDSIDHVDYYLNEVKVATDALPSDTSSHTLLTAPVAPGSYRSYVVITDSRGATTKSSTITAMVSNHRPSVSFTAPGNNASITPASALVISVNGTDPDIGDSIVKTVFYVNGTALSTNTVNTWNWNIPAGAATYTLSLVAFDSHGLASTNVNSIQVTSVVDSWTPLNWNKKLNVTISGSSVTKNATSATWDAGALEMVPLSRVNGHIRCDTATTAEDSQIMFGLTTSFNLSPSVKYAFIIDSSTSTYYVREFDVIKTPTTATFTPGAQFEIAIFSNYVSYYIIDKNTGARNRVYTSTALATSLTLFPTTYLKYNGNTCYRGMKL